MKNILLCWFYDADLVIVPDFVADDLLTYQKKFLKWIEKKSNNHGYWTRKFGKLILAYDGEAFVKWLNEYIIENENEKAEITKKEFLPSEEDMKLPKIYF